MHASDHCMNEYQGSVQKRNQLPQKSGRHDQGPIYLHNLQLCNLEQQQTCKEDLHGSNFPVENIPEEYDDNTDQQEAANEQVGLTHNT